MRLVMLLGLAAVVVEGGASAEEGRIAFPAEYRSAFTNYLSLDRVQEEGQIIRLFANAAAMGGMDENGKFLALDVDLIAAMGAYLHTFGPFIPFLGATMATGIYDIPTMFVQLRGTYTNTTPTDAYRGAGRPEAAYHLERLVDLVQQPLTG